MRKPVLIGIGVFSGLLLLTQYISYQRYLIRKEVEQQYVLRELQAVEDRLATAIGYSLSSVKTLAFIVAEYGVPENFDSVASNILHSARYIDALQLTQKGVITHTYPSKGNEAALGFDILSDTATRQEANIAIAKRALFFAGPFQLKQGGKGVVGRFPIFKKNEFQGFAVVIIRLTTLLKAIGIDTVQQGEFMYQLSKTNPTTQQDEYFLPHYFDVDEGEYASIDVPAGHWKIMIKAKSHERLFFNISFSIVGLLLSFTGGAFAWYLAWQPEKLRDLVNQKTALVIDAQNQYKTTLERVSDGFISYDREWRYRYLNWEAEHVLGLKLNDVVGKVIWEEFPQLKDQPIYDAYHKAIADQRYVFIVSYLPGLEKWFENHLYPASDGLSVFFRDVTQRRKIEEEIIQAYKEKETVLSRISDSVFSLDNEWRYTFLNDAALADHPLGRERTLGNVIWDVHPEMRGTLFWDKYHEAKNLRRPVEFESFYAPMDIWFYVKVYPSSDGLTIFYNNVTERKRTEQLIRESEARMVAAQEVARVGSWETNLATLEVVWSLQTYKIFELDPVIFNPTHITFLDFVHPQDRDRVDKAFAESFRSDDSCSVEHRIITKKGQVKWVEERWRVYLNGQQKPYRATGTCQDITERKVAEVEMRLLINNTEESFIMLDSNLSIVSYNDQFDILYKKYFGLVIEKGKSILEYAKPERREMLQNLYQNVLNGQHEEREFDFQSPDGLIGTHSIKYKPARNETDEIIGVFVTTRDITEKKRRDDEIRAEKIFSDSLINSLPGIFYLYDQHGRFRRWNENFETISGYTAIEIRHMHPLDFYDGDEKNLMRQKIEKVFADGNEEVTAHFFTKDKRKIPYYFNGHKISYAGNDYLIGVGVDISERVRAEKDLLTHTNEIKRLTAHLEHVREEERTRISREIHDELGQQLTGLKMDASWLTQKISKEEKALHEKLSGMISLMDNTVKTIRRISSDLRPGILDDLGLVAALEWQCSEFFRDTEIKSSFISSVEEVNVERDLSTAVFRIFQESLTNVMRHAKASSVEASLTQTDKEIILNIADNGVGFDVAETKARGTLGLIGIRERALMVGASVQIVSEKGAGTRVILKIPVA